MIDDDDADDLAMFGGLTVQPAPRPAASRPRKPRKVLFVRGRYANLPPLPGETKARTWMRTSTLAKAMADNWALSTWEQQKLVVGLASRPSLLADVPEVDDFDWTSSDEKDALNTIIDIAHELADSQRGAITGTELHELTEKLDSGRLKWDLLIPSYRKIVTAYQELIRAHEITFDPSLMERTIVCPELECAGTFDRIGRYKGVPMIGDVKTQKWEPGAYDKVALGIQEAIYANGSYMLDPIEWEWQPMPEVDKSTGLVYWIPSKDPGHAGLYRIDLVKGWRLAIDAKMVRDDRKIKGVVTRIDLPNDRSS
jgi:hypothetical protein